MTDKPTTGDPTPLIEVTLAWMRGVLAEPEREEIDYREAAIALLTTLDAEREARPVPAGDERELPDFVWSAHRLNAESAMNAEYPSQWEVRGPTDIRAAVTESDR